MIENAEYSKSGIYILENSPFKFYLTGSRFFGNDNPHSDYDFFCADYEDIREYLIANGFKKHEIVETKYIGNEDILALYRREDCEVQIVKDIEIRKMVQDVIFGMVESKTVRFSCKSERKLLWKIALTVAKEMKNLMKQ